MPELPDIAVYVERLEAKALGRTLQKVRVFNPFVLRTAVPPLAHAEGRRVAAIQRLGKRVVLALDGDYFLVIHLMVAGRLRWLASAAKPPGKIALAGLEFDSGTLLLTEAGTMRRASIHLVDSRAALQAMDPGGIDVLAADVESFARQLTAQNHTLKRSLTDPRLFSGIGNAYSDEILHRAKKEFTGNTSQPRQTRSFNRTPLRRLRCRARRQVSRPPATCRCGERAPLGISERGNPGSAGILPARFDIIKATRRQDASAPGSRLPPHLNPAALHHQTFHHPLPDHAGCLACRTNQTVAQRFWKLARSCATSQACLHRGS